MKKKKKMHEMTSPVLKIKKKKQNKKKHFKMLPAEIFTQHAKH